MADLADRLKWAMTDRNMGVLQLADAAGLSRVAVTNYRRGAQSGARRGADSVQRMAKALGVDPDWLHTGEGEAPIGWEQPHVPPYIEQAATAAQRRKLFRRCAVHLNAAEVELLTTELHNSIATLEKSKYRQARKLAQLLQEMKGKIERAWGGPEAVQEWYAALHAAQKRAERKGLVPPKAK